MVWFLYKNLKGTTVGTEVSRERNLEKDKKDRLKFEDPGKWPKPLIRRLP
jgi:hypothetical protein